MKKSILALAVLAGFAGAAHAQSSNVSIYGIADVGYVRDSGASAAGTTSTITSGGQSASRLGFKGTRRPRQRLCRRSSRSKRAC